MVGYTPIVNKTYITFLVEFLPEDSVYFRINGIGSDRPSRLALALNDPKFGWNWVKSIKEDGLEVPYVIGHLQLLRANDYLNGTYNEIMDEALFLLHPANTTARNMLKALLISRDLTLVGIANWMRLPWEVVRIFDQLFFNVRDRLDEPGYIAQRLNSDGVRLNPGADKEELLLLRAGFRIGAREVIRLGGIKANRTGQSNDELLRDFERETLLRANTCIRHGGEEDTGSPVVAAARALAIANKRIQRDEPPTNTLAQGFEELYKFHPVLDAIDRMIEPSVNRMIQLSQQSAGKKPGPSAPG